MSKTPYYDETGTLRHFYTFSAQELNEIAHAFGIKYNDEDLYWIFNKDKVWSAKVIVKDAIYNNFMAETYPQDYDDEFKYKAAKQFWICRALIAIDKDIEGFYLL